MSQEKKSSIVVIALAIICVILAAGFIGTLALYLPNQTQITEKDQTIASQNQQIASLQDQIAQAPDMSLYQQQINALKTQVSSLNESLSNISAQYGPLRDIVSLSKYQLLYSNTTAQNPQGNTTLCDTQLAYAGYITVQATSNSSTTYAQISYVFNDYTVSYNQTLGTFGTVLFAVLPAKVSLVVGNLETDVGTQITVAVTYVY